MSEEDFQRVGLANWGQHLDRQTEEIAAKSDLVKRLRAALRECEAELDAYYRTEYPSDHPVHQRKLAKALKNNPARVALKELGDG